MSALSMSLNLRPVHFSEAGGMVAGTAITPYPPGIPAIAPGEIIDPELIAELAALRQQGKKVIGIDSQGYILVDAG